MALSKTLFPLLLAGTLALSSLSGADSTPEADASWRDLRNARPVPNLPAEWETTPPSDQLLIRQTLRAESERLLALAERARAFTAAYPGDPRRESALKIAGQALLSAQKMGSPTARKQLADLDAARLLEPALSPADRLEIRMRQVQADAEALSQNSAEEARDKFEAGARSLIHEFPGESAPWAMLLECVDQGNDDASRAKLKEVADGAPKPVGSRAEAILHRYNALGTAIDMKFTAIDGREVDLAKLRGKIVIIQFWASWCTTCVEGLTSLAKAYNALQDLGVEVIGINVDTSKAKAQQVIDDKSIEWPQFFETAGQNNRIVREWGVTTLPSMWLLDRNGILRDLVAKPELNKKIKLLIDESPTAAR